MAYVRRSGTPKALITWDAASVAATMRILKATDKAIYDELRKTLRNEAKNIKAEQSKAVKGLASKGSSGGGHTSRAASGFLSSVGKNASKANERTLARAIRGSGLRDSAARALKIEYRERATARRPFLGIRVRMSSSALPADQRRLPKHMNYGRWRHPVYGNDNRWVTQTALPEGWFDGTFARMKPGAQKALGRAIDAAFRKAGLAK